MTDPLQAAQSEVARQTAECAAVEGAGTDPLEIAQVRIALEMAQRRLADATEADRQRQEREQVEATDRLLDTIWPQIDQADAEEWDALKALRIAAEDLHRAHQRRSQTARYCIGNVTSTVRPDSTPRYRLDAGTPKIDGRRITSTSAALTTSVAAIVADLIALGLPGVGSELRTAGRVGNPLRPPHQKAKA